MNAAVPGISRLLLPALLAAAGLALGLLARAFIARRLAAAAARTASVVDDAFVGALRGPVVLWGLVLGLHLAARASPLPPSVSRLLPDALLILLIASVTWVLARVSSDLVGAHALKITRDVPSATLVPNAVRLGILLAGFLVVLQTLGISITPLLTALGVGGIAVALALQDTLANFFAGVHVLVSKQVRPGDFIRLEGGEDGFVEDITWRTTTIRQLRNNLVSVPNAKLASAITTNFSLPETEMSVVVDVGVAYDSDLDEVERVTLDVARDVQRRVDGAVEDFEPLLRFRRFGESAVELAVILRARTYVAQFLLTHEFVKRLHRRYGAEGIEIPFPMRTVQMRAAPVMAGKPKWTS
jgi:small-conductance mechanosensitive channel